MVTLAIGMARGPTRTVGFRLAARASQRRSTPTPFNALFRQRAEVSLLRRRIARPRRSRNVDRVPIGVAARLGLRDRLSPG